MVPGMGGSVLVRRGHEHRRVGHRRILDNRWINLEPLSPARMRKWDRDMACAYDPDHRRLTGYDEDIQPLDVGGLDGVRDIVPEFGLLSPYYRGIVDRMYSASYFGTMCDRLLALGHRERETLMGFPYDFRLVLDPACREATFARLRALVEASSAPAVLVCHSIGGVLVRWFLGEQGHAWTQRHVHHVVMVNVPWGGIPAGTRALVCGDHYCPLFASLFRATIQTNSAVVMCLPNALAFGPDEPLLRVAGGAPVTASTYGRHAHANVGFLMWKQLFEPHLEAQCATQGARVTMVTSEAGQVATAFECEHEDRYASPVAHEPGDGTVPLRSLRAHGRLFDGREARVHLRDVGHSAVLRDPRLLDLVARLASS